MNTREICESIAEYCMIPSVSAYRNGRQTPKRIKYIKALLEKLNIIYIHDTWSVRNNPNNIFHNIYLPGDSTLVFTAHHDTTGRSAGANDNTASVFNLIALKNKFPNTNIALLDGEEIGGFGSERLSDVMDEYFEDAFSILNLELTGKGGKRFFLGKTEQIQIISEFIKSMPEFSGKLPIPEMKAPFNDSVIFRENGIDSVVINALPPLINNQYQYHYPIREIYFTDGIPLDTSLIGYCNGRFDSIEIISIEDMIEFVDYVLTPIFKAWESMETEQSL